MNISQTWRRFLDTLCFVLRLGARPRRRRGGVRSATLLRTSPMEHALESRVLLSANAAGAEFQVNTFVTESQSFGTNTPHTIASSASGDFVVVWSSYAQSDSYDIYAQRYNSLGVPQGSEFLVNTFTTGTQDVASVAMDADGDFVVTWISDGQDGSGYGVFAQRYNASGVRQGSEFRVNTFTTGDQDRPVIAMDSDGDFVVGWTSTDQDGSQDGIFAQRYTAAGATSGTEFRVNTFTTNHQRLDSVAMDDDGDFVVTWGSLNQDGGDFGIFAQLFESDGSLVGSEFAVSDITTNIQAFSAVAMDADGDFIITWTTNLQDGSDDEIFAKRYNALGVAQSSDFRVNTTTSGNQSFSSIAMDNDGDFVISWTGYYQDGDADAIVAQCYSANGTPRGSEFVVNTFTLGNQSTSAVAMDANGDFVVAWTSYSQDGDLGGVFAQRFDPTTPSLVDISDNEPNNLIVRNDVVTYTVTFDEAIDAATLSTTDFTNALSGAGAATFTVQSVNATADPKVFTVAVQITSLTGSFILRIPSGVVISDLNGNNLPTTTAIDDNDVMLCDTEGPSLLTITDNNTTPDDVYILNQTLTYTLTFSEDIDASTFLDTFIENAEPVTPASFTVGAITETTPTSGIFTVAVTITSGTVFRLSVDMSDLRDAQGNALNEVSVNDESVMTLDTFPPTLTSITDDTTGLLQPLNGLINYTVSFNVDMDASSFTASDISNGEPGNLASFSVESISETTATSGVFNVQIKLTSGGNFRLQVGANVADLGGNNLGSPINDDNVYATDIVAPTIQGATVDDADRTVAVNDVVTYTLSFNEALNLSSLTAADFSNTGTATISFGDIAEQSPGVYTIAVSPTTVGSIVLRIATTATIEDLYHNFLDTNLAPELGIIITVI